MQLSLGTNEVLQSKPLEQHSYSIGDEGVIQWLLRDKLYNNPIRVVVQEYCSNARDAHREVNNIEPIVVSLPTHLDPHLKIKDAGPGISPDRMVNVFLRLGCSTKRDNNKQNGGFGIGAKSAFAYTTSFSVITTVDKVKRVYNAYLDESKKAAMNLAQEMPCDEPNGTEILIPVEQKDIEEFCKWFYFCTAFWDTQPTVTNPVEQLEHKYHHKAQDAILRHKHWAILEEEVIEEQSAVAIVDGIPYGIPAEQLGLTTYNRTDDLYELSQILREVNIALYFKVGEIEVSASREALNYTDITKRVVIERLRQIASEIAESATATIIAKPTFHSACCTLSDLCEAVGHTILSDKLKKLKVDWNGYTVMSTFQLTYPLPMEGTDKLVEQNVASMTEYCRNEKRGESVSHVRYQAHTQFCWGEVGHKFVRAKVETLFTQDPSLKRVLVLYPTLQNPMNQRPGTPDYVAGAKKWRAERVDILNPLDLASVVPARIKSNKPKTTRSVATGAIGWLCRFNEHKSYLDNNIILPTDTELLEKGSTIFNPFYVIKNGREYLIPDSTIRGKIVHKPVYSREEVTSYIENNYIHTIFGAKSINSFSLYFVKGSAVNKLGKAWKPLFEHAQKEITNWAVKNPQPLALGWYAAEKESNIRSKSLVSLCGNVTAVTSIGKRMTEDTFLGRIGRHLDKYGGGYGDYKHLYQAWKLLGTNPECKPDATMTFLIEELKTIKSRYPLFGLLSDNDYDDKWKKTSYLDDAVFYVQKRDEEYVKTQAALAAAEASVKPLIAEASSNV